MNVFVEVLLSVIRWALGALFGALVLHGVITPELLKKVQESGGVEITTWLTTAALPLGWIWWKNSKLANRIKIALNLPAGSTPADLKDAEKGSAQ